MKTITARCLVSAAVVCIALMPPAAGAQAPQKAYTLFTGANIWVNLDKSIYPVRDVNGSSWVVEIDGQEHVVSAKQGPINLKIVPVQKLTDVSATIAAFKREPAYTFANDPSVKLTRGQSRAAGVSAGYEAASNQAGAIDPSQLNTPGASGTQSSGGTASAHGQSSGAAALANATAGVGASVDFQAKQPEAAGYDAMNVEFNISSEKPLKDAYIVTMTRFHPRGSEPDTVQSLVFAKALDPIGANPTTVKFAEEGFPIDYEVVDFQLHLYDGGTEIATNVAEKREVMTPEQAFEYVRKTYIESHKGDTMKAVPVMGELPTDAAERIASGKYAETIYVRVSKDGLADGAFSDSVCSKRIDDPYLETLVRDLRFKPALAQGTPVEGIAALNLSKLGI